MFEITLGTAQPPPVARRGRVRAQGAGPVRRSLLLQLQWEQSRGEEERGEERTRWGRRLEEEIEKRKKESRRGKETGEKKQIEKSI